MKKINSLLQTKVIKSSINLTTDGNSNGANLNNNSNGNDSNLEPSFNSSKQLTKQNNTIKNKNSNNQKFKDKIAYPNYLEKAASLDRKNISFAKKLNDQSPTLTNESTDKLSPNIKRNKSLLDINPNLNKIASTLLKSKVNSQKQFSKTTNNEMNKDSIQANSEIDSNSLDYSKLRENFNEIDMSNSVISLLNSPKGSGNNNINFEDLLQRQNVDLEDKNNSLIRKVSKNDSYSELNISKNKLNISLNNSINLSKSSKISSIKNGGPKLKYSKTLTDKDKFKIDVANKSKATVRRSSTKIDAPIPTTNLIKRNSLSQKNFVFGNLIKKIFKNKIGRINSLDENSLDKCDGENSNNATVNNKVSMDKDDNKLEKSFDIENNKLDTSVGGIKLSEVLEDKFETSVGGIKLNEVVNQKLQTSIKGIKLNEPENMSTSVLKNKQNEVDNNLNTSVHQIKPNKAYNDKFENSAKISLNNEVNNSLENEEDFSNSDLGVNDDNLASSEMLGTDEKIIKFEDEENFNYEENLVISNSHQKNNSHNKYDLNMDDEKDNRILESKGGKKNVRNINPKNSINQENSIDSHQIEAKDHSYEKDNENEPIIRELSRIDEEELVNFSIEKFDILLKSHIIKEKLIDSNQYNMSILGGKQTKNQIYEINQNSLNIPCKKKTHNVNSINQINAFNIINKKLNINEIEKIKTNFQVKSSYPHRSEQALAIGGKNSCDIYQGKKTSISVIIITNQACFEIKKIEKSNPNAINQVNNIEILGFKKQTKLFNQNIHSFEIKKKVKRDFNLSKVSSFNLPSKIISKPESAKLSQKINSFCIPNTKINLILEEQITQSFIINPMKNLNDRSFLRDKEENVINMAMDTPGRKFIDSPSRSEKRKRNSMGGMNDAQTETILPINPPETINSKARLIDELAEFEDDLNRRINQTKSITLNNFSFNNSKFADKVNLLKTKLDQDFEHYDDNAIISEEDLLDFQVKYFPNDEFINKDLLSKFYKKYMNKQSTFDSPKLKNNKQYFDFFKKNNLKMREKEQIDNKNNIKKIRDFLEIEDKYLKVSNDNFSQKSSEANVNPEPIFKGSKILLGRSGNSCGIMPSNNILASSNKNGNINPYSVLDNNFKFKK